MNNKSEERSHKQIMKCVKELSEGYDTVQIFLTRPKQSAGSELEVQPYFDCRSQSLLLIGYV